MARIALLDVDGTLVDTNYLHTLAWSRALRDVGESVPMNVIHRLVGMGGDQLTLRLFDRVDDQMAQGWRRHYEQLLGEVRPFPGAAELLRCVHDAGLAVVLASSSPEEHVEAMVDLLGVAGVVDSVTSANDATTSKPAPDIFEAALDAGHVDPGRALVVGDSVWDVRAGRSAGLGAIAVESGGFSRHELAEEGATAVYRDVQELLHQWRTSPMALLLR
jgi:HAD superfamily hydrolase (TIGR01509 family)